MMCRLSKMIEEMEWRSNRMYSGLVMAQKLLQKLKREQPRKRAAIIMAEHKVWTWESYVIDHFSALQILYGRRDAAIAEDQVGTWELMEIMTPHQKGAKPLAWDQVFNGNTNVVDLSGDDPETLAGEEVADAVHRGSKDGRYTDHYAA